MNETFEYQHSLQQYRDETNRLLTEIDKTIDDLSNSPIQIGEIKNSICRDMLKKTSSIIKGVVANETNLINFAATLRYTFETLIHTGLLLKEPEHILRLGYNIHIHQVEKYHKLVKRIDEEVELLKEIEIFEEPLVLSVPILSEEEIDKKIEAQFGHKITTFFEGVKWNGYGFHSHLLKNKIKEQYKMRLRKHEEEKKEFEKELCKNKSFQNSHGINVQATQIQVLLSDNRSWEQKAQEVNLQGEYALMYDITSSILHAVSYSLLTNQEINEQEKKIYYNWLNQYTKLIIKNIRLYCGLIQRELQQRFVPIEVVQDAITNEHEIDTKNLKSSGYCPQCFFIDDKKQKISMLINRNDYFECPECRLQMTYNEPSKIASIFPVRGNGSPYKDNYKSKTYIKGFYLSAAAMDNGFTEVSTSFFKTIEQLKEYLSTIK